LHRSLLFAVVISLLAQTIASHAQKPVRRVLIFNDFSSISSPGIGLLDNAIAMDLETSPYQIELYNENIESTLFQTMLLNSAPVSGTVKNIQIANRM
jgi:hypothetical protein